jgi:hypothetical protein
VRGSHWRCLALLGADGPCSVAQVLFGELSEDAYRDSVRMSGCLAELLRAVARSSTSRNHTKARTADCLEALDSFFPEKDTDARKAIHKALRAHAKKEVRRRPLAVCGVKRCDGRILLQNVRTWACVTMRSSAPDGDV